MMFRFLALAIALLSATPLLAEFGQPFRSVSRHPLKMARHEPLPRSALAFGEDQMVFNADMEFTSNFVFKRGEESLVYTVFDHEALSLRLSGGYAIDKNWAITANLGLFHFMDGFLDSFLEDYHDILGLPNSGRADRPHNEFHSKIGALNGPSLLGGEGNGLRLSNLALGVQWQAPEPLAWSGGILAYGARASVSLPTGDKAALLRGGPEISIGALGSLVLPGFSLDGNLDLMIPMDDDPFETPILEAKPWVRMMLSGSGSLGAGWLGRVQVALGSASLNSVPSFKNVERMTALLSFGVQWQVGAAVFSASFMEDLYPSSDADFSLLLGSSWSF